MTWIESNIYHGWNHLDIQAAENKTSYLAFNGLWCFHLTTSALFLQYWRASAASLQLVPELGLVHATLVQGKQTHSTPQSACPTPQSCPTTIHDEPTLHGYSKGVVVGTADEWPTACLQIQSNGTWTTGRVKESFTRIPTDGVSAGSCRTDATIPSTDDVSASGGRANETCHSPRFSAEAVVRTTNSPYVAIPPSYVSPTGGHKEDRNIWWSIPTTEATKPQERAP